MDATPTPLTAPADDLDQQPLGEFLAQLAARPPAPGAGATAAIEAALVAMVGRFTVDPDHVDVVDAIVPAAGARRDACLAVVDDPAARADAVERAVREAMRR